MKKCPQCKRTFPDDTLAFCLADGALLSAPYDPNATIRIPSSAEPSVDPAVRPLPQVEAEGSPENLRVPATGQPHAAHKTTEVLRTPTVAESPRQKSNPLFLYLSIAFACLFVGALIVVVWMMSGKTEPSANTNTRTEPERTVSSNPATPAPTVAAIDISGNWRDQFGFVSYITQQENSFEMKAAGTGCRGNFNTSAVGLIRGNTFEMTYTSTYSTGSCTGTISADGSRITSDCTDSACGRFITASRKE